MVYAQKLAKHLCSILAVVNTKITSKMPHAMNGSAENSYAKSQKNPCLTSCPFLHPINTATLPVDSLPITFTAYHHHITHFSSLCLPSNTFTHTLTLTLAARLVRVPELLLRPRRPLSSHGPHTHPCGHGTLACPPMAQ